MVDTRKYIQLDDAWRVVLDTVFGGPIISLPPMLTLRVVYPFFHEFLYL